LLKWGGGPPAARAALEGNTVVLAEGADGRVRVNGVWRPIQASSVGQCCAIARALLTPGSRVTAGDGTSDSETSPTVLGDAQSAPQNNGLLPKGENEDGRQKITGDRLRGGAGGAEDGAGEGLAGAPSVDGSAPGRDIRGQGAGSGDNAAGKLGQGGGEAAGVTARGTYEPDTLVGKYGEQGAQSALDLARKLVQRDPRMARMLDATGLGNHPQVIDRFVRLAMDERYKGRLK
jgi:hypothetical protein